MLTKEIKKMERDHPEKVITGYGTCKFCGQQAACKMLEDWTKAAERLRGVQIDNRPAEKIIDQYNHENVLQYWDPPYMLGTRYGKQYRYEMSDREHDILLEKAIKSRAKIIISGYDSVLYNDMLKDWYRCETVAYSQVASKKRKLFG